MDKYKRQNKRQKGNVLILKGFCMFHGKQYVKISKHEANKQRKR